MTSPTPAIVSSNEVTGAEITAQPSPAEVYDASADNASVGTAATAVAPTVMYGDTSTPDVDVVLATLKTLLVTAGYSISVYDQLASAAKVLGTK